MGSVIFPFIVSSRPCRIFFTSCR